MLVHMILLAGLPCKSTARAMVAGTARILYGIGIIPDHIRFRLYSIRDRLRLPVDDLEIEAALWRCPEARPWLPERWKDHE